MSVAYVTEGRVIASRSRATQLAERIAEKHDMEVRTMLCARWDRFAIAARAELASELKASLGWSQRRIGEYLGCTHPNVRKLFSYHEMTVKRAKRWLPKADVHALLAVEADERLLRAMDAEERAAEAEAELRRLSGVDIVLRLAEALDIRHLRCAIVLAIVCEAYPRTVLGADMIRYYDEACERLDYGDRNGSTFGLLAKNVGKLREHFVECGWPVPIAASASSARDSLAGARRLEDDAAKWLHERLGMPRLSQMQAADEARSKHVHALAVR